MTVKPSIGPLTNDEKMHRVDALLAHVWMVRTFVKHSEEAAEDEELSAVHRALYDYALALGKPWREQDAAAYLKQARKKLGKLKRAANDFAELQPEVSTHTNFQMAVASLTAAVQDIASVLEAE